MVLSEEHLVRDSKSMDDCAYRKLSAVRNSLERERVQAQSHQRSGNSEGNGIHRAAISGDWWSQAQGNACRGALLPRTIMATPGFRLRAGRSGDGDRPLAGQPRFVLVPVAALRATLANPWQAKDVFGIRDSTL